MNDRVQVTVHDGVAEVRLSRPDKLNALDLPMFTGLIAAARSVTRDDRVRAVILYGEGPSFSSGLDVKAAAKGPSMAARIFMKPFWTRDNIAQRVALVWRDVRVPVIAAIHGRCYGGALQIALGADFRIAAPDAELSIMEIKLGIIPDMSISVTLRELIRSDQAKDLAMTGRLVSGTEAAAMGLVTATADDPLAEARRRAAQIAAQPIPAIRGIKALFRDSWTAPVRRALRLERSIQTQVLARRGWQMLRAKKRIPTPSPPEDR